MKKQINNPLYLLYAFSLLFSVLTGCKKLTNELPGDTPATALNFYPASDVMTTAYGLTAAPNNPNYTALQVDNYQLHPVPFPFTSGSKIPTWGFDQNGAGEFPSLAGRIPGGLINFANYDYRENGHHLFFTDTANVVQLDTVIHPAPQSYTCVYLADATVSIQNRPAAYKMLAVTEDRAGVPANKVGVRFVHLSPDAGSLNVSLLKADGSLLALLPESISYGQASAYQYLDSTAIAANLIKFSLNNSATGAAVSTGIAFTPGHSYIVLVTGFMNDQQRQVRSGTNPDGSTKYTSVNISRNLRAIIRKSY